MKPKSCVTFQYWLTPLSQPASLPSFIIYDFYFSLFLQKKPRIEIPPSFPFCLMKKLCVYVYVCIMYVYVCSGCAGDHSMCGEVSSSFQDALLPSRVWVPKTGLCQGEQETPLPAEPSYQPPEFVNKALIWCSLGGPVGRNLVLLEFEAFVGACW